MARRTKTSPAPAQFRWNNSRQKAIELLQEYYLLRVNDFVSLTKARQDENARRSIQNILQALLAKRYIGRLRYFDDTAERATIVYAYFLNDSGAALLEDPAAAFTKESQLIPRHEIEITQFHMHLKRWTDKCGLILHWRQPKMDHGKTINPDAYFGIEDPKLPVGKNTFHYFLEMERSPLGNYKNGEPSIMRKLAKYYELYDSSDCEKQWGFRKFRVVTVVRNADKMYNLCKLMSEKFSHRMFWMTTEPLFRENIGGEIFHTPKDWQKIAYSFTTL
ncbi:MAG TPA: replication-relaxation family protein [Terracidiphilus sp.]|nr:replication-relaxation family protein [Terracidiphilus sp.]